MELWQWIKVSVINCFSDPIPVQITMSNSCDSSEENKSISYFYDSGTTREKEVIQLASVRNKAILFSDKTNYNNRQRKLANFIGGESRKRENNHGDWILRYTNSPHTADYPWFSSKKFNFELVPWRKQKRSEDIINTTAWEPKIDQIEKPSNQKKSNKIDSHKNYRNLKQNARHYQQEIRKQVRLRILFSVELRHRKMQVLQQRKRISPRSFERILDSDCGLSLDQTMESNPSASDCENNLDIFLGYFNSKCNATKSKKRLGSEKRLHAKKCENLANNIHSMANKQEFTWPAIHHLSELDRINHSNSAVCNKCSR